MLPLAFYVSTVNQVRHTVHSLKLTVLYKYSLPCLTCQSCASLPGWELIFMLSIWWLVLSQFLGQHVTSHFSQHQSFSCMYLGKTSILTFVCGETCLHLKLCDLFDLFPVPAEETAWACLAGHCIKMMCWQRWLAVFIIFAARCHCDVAGISSINRNTNYRSQSSHRSTASWPGSWCLTVCEFKHRPWIVVKYTAMLY